ncbi:MAG TPA: response regulator [Elusimicrobiales bacterium]|nr:response regulator [Elusimicrobiales bacterium]
MPLHNKILIADDDADMLELLRNMLEREGYSVITAENGQEAVDLARKELPALVMLDIHMPVMDGLQACKQIKEDQVSKNIPVLMLTVEGSINEIQTAIGYGARTYITKPSSRVEIIKVVKSILA